MELELLSVAVALSAVASSAALGCGSAVPKPEAHVARPAPAVPAPLPAPAAPAPAVVVPPPSAEPVPSAPPEPTPEPLPKGTLVLQVGDSFAGALGVTLAKRFRAVGVRSTLEYKTASYIPTWAFGPELPRFISDYNPDLVLVTLGANELEIVNPEQRAGAVRRLVSKLGGRPCVWIGPPLWKKDTGVIQVIHDNAAPCRFLDSTAIVHDLPRGPDKIHPTAAGREAWAEVVFQWLTRERDPAAAKPWALKPEH